MEKAASVISALALAIVAGVVVWVGVLKPVPQGAPPPVEVVNESFAETPEMRLFGTNKVTLVEFTDFQCPFCKQHATERLPEIEKLPVTYLSVNYPLEAIHPHARKAALAAVCASNAYDTHKRLFATPLDTLQDTACMQSVGAKEAVRAHIALARQLGVRGTPTFFLGTRAGQTVTVTRKFSGGVRPDVLRDEIERLGAYER